LNPHRPYGPGDFKSPVSTIPPLRLVDAIVFGPNRAVKEHAVGHVVGGWPSEKAELSVLVGTCPARVGPRIGGGRIPRVTVRSVRVGCLFPMQGGSAPARRVPSVGVLSVPVVGRDRDLFQRRCVVLRSYRRSQNLRDSGNGGGGSDEAAQTSREVLRRDGIVSVDEYVRLPESPGEPVGDAGRPLLDSNGVDRRVSGNHKTQYQGGRGEDRMGDPARADGVGDGEGRAVLPQNLCRRGWFAVVSVVKPAGVTEFDGDVATEDGEGGGEAVSRNGVPGKTGAVSAAAAARAARRAPRFDPENPAAPAGRRRVLAGG
jgi:hypothetical protein